MAELERKSIILRLGAAASTLFFCVVAFFFVKPTPSESSLRVVLAAAMATAAVWGCISTWARVFVYEKAGLRPPMKLFPGYRPTDPVELQAWRWHWQFYIAFIVLILSGSCIALSTLRSE